MLNLIIAVVIGLIVGAIAVSIRNSIVNKYRVSGLSETEQFKFYKLLQGMFGVSSATLWAKDITSIFSIRKIIIYLIILASIFGYGYFKGLQGKPVHVDIGYGKEAYIKLDGNFLHIKTDGTMCLEDKNGKVIKIITAKDMPGLNQILAPVALQFKPIGIIGYGMGTTGDAGLEAGVGFSFARIYKLALDAFITNMGIYGGCSYSLEGAGLKNSSIGVGVGHGWTKDDWRGLIYFKIAF